MCASQLVEVLAKLTTTALQPAMSVARKVAIAKVVSCAEVMVNVFDQANVQLSNLTALLPKYFTNACQLVAPLVSL